METKAKTVLAVGAVGIGTVLAVLIGRRVFAKAGFTLKLKNAPSGEVLWNANFYENTWKYDPIADSGWIKATESWGYPNDPLECTTLFIQVWDVSIPESPIEIFHIMNLGPVENGKSYIFDCETLELKEI